MRAVLLRRSGDLPPVLPPGVDVIRTLTALPRLIATADEHG
jgi:hypothetical protein